MARKSDSGSASDKAAAHLTALRAQIDKLDLHILELLNKRAAVAVQIGKVKADKGGEIFSAAREEEVFANVLDANKGPLDAIAIKAIFRELISGSRAIQKPQKIAYLGSEYGPSHLAAIQRFGEAAVYNRASNVTAVFEEVLRKNVDFGVVPFDNSADGRITDILELFFRYPELVKVCAEIRLRVRLHLLANCTQSEVRRVYAKAQPLSQCRGWLSKNLPQASLHEVSGTTDAAKLVQSEPNVAAVASREASVRYGLNIISNDIEDSPSSESRFAVLGPVDSARTGDDKTATVLHIEHTPAALAKIMGVFKANKINLIWIETFPHTEAKNQYIFLVGFGGHRDEQKVKKTLASLAKICESLLVLGSFPAAELAAE